MEREMMLQKLMELDFLAVDLGLYLNTIPQKQKPSTPIIRPSKPQTPCA